MPTRPHAKRNEKRGPGEYKEAKGFRLYALGKDDMVQIASWHQIQDADQCAIDLRKVAQRIPADKVRIAHPEQGLGVVFPLLFLHSILKCKEGWTLSKKNRESSYRCVFDTITGIITNALIWKLLYHRTKIVHQFIKCEELGIRFGAMHRLTFLLDNKMVAIHLLGKRGTLVLKHFRDTR